MLFYDSMDFVLDGTVADAAEADLLNTAALVESHLPPMVSANGSRAHWDAQDAADVKAAADADAEACRERLHDLAHLVTDD